MKLRAVGRSVVTQSPTVAEVCLAVSWPRRGEVVDACFLFLPCRQ